MSQTLTEIDFTYRQRTSLKKLLGNDEGVSSIGNTVAVAGWVRSLRLQGRDTFAFVMLNDGSTISELQIVVSQECPGWEHILPSHDVSVSAAIFVVGEVLASAGKGQKIEMKAKLLKLCGVSPANEYPLAGKNHTVEYLREVGHLRARTQLISSITRVRNALAYATHQYFQGLGYIYLNAPIITASDCEGAGEMFQITTVLGDKKVDEIPKTADGKVDYSADFFKKPAFLTVSGQLNAECFACAMGSVYTFGPTFRAENSNTSRHLAEFWMIEPEIAFADLFENMEIAEGYVKFALKYAMATCPEELKWLENYEKQCLGTSKGAREFRSTPLTERLTAVAEAEFARVTYTEAIDILKASNVKFEVEPYWGMDMGSEHERWLAETYFNKPTIVFNYPLEFKSFYMRRNEDGKTVAAMDVLVPGVGELIGGSQREERLDVLLDTMKLKGLDASNYTWYTDLRKYGTVVHSGFGLGFERLVCYTTGVENIREVIPFPRWPGHADF